MPNLVTLPVGFYPNPETGKPVGLGQVFLGTAGLDPAVEINRITVLLVQEDGSTVTIPPASQPIQLGAGGVPMYNGSPVVIYVTEDDYSMKVTTSNGAQIYYFENVEALSNASVFQDFSYLVGNVDSSLVADIANDLYFPVVGSLARVGYFDTNQVSGSGAEWKCTSVNADTSGFGTATGTINGRKYWAFVNGKLYVEVTAGGDAYEFTYVLPSVHRGGTTPYWMAAEGDRFVTNQDGQYSRGVVIGCFSEGADGAAIFAGNIASTEEAYVLQQLQNPLVVVGSVFNGINRTSPGSAYAVATSAPRSVISSVSVNGVRNTDGSDCEAIYLKSPYAATSNIVLENGGTGEGALQLKGAPSFAATSPEGHSSVHSSHVIRFTPEYNIDVSPLSTIGCKITPDRISISNMLFEGCSGASVMFNAQSDCSHSRLANIIAHYCGSGANGAFVVNCVGRGIEMSNLFANNSLDAWQGTTVYVRGQRVQNGSDTYVCTAGGTSSGSGGPAGTGKDIADGTVVWVYAGPASRGRAFRVQAQNAETDVAFVNCSSVGYLNLFDFNPADDGVLSASIIGGASYNASSGAINIRKRLARLFVRDFVSNLNQPFVFSGTGAVERADIDLSCTSLVTSATFATAFQFVILDNQVGMLNIDVCAGDGADSAVWQLAANVTAASGSASIDDFVVVRSLKTSGAASWDATINANANIARLRVRSDTGQSPLFTCRVRMVLA
jgi:hypothetical protein